MRKRLDVQKQEQKQKQNQPNQKTTPPQNPERTSSNLSETVKLRFRTTNPPDHSVPLHKDVGIFRKLGLQFNVYDPLPKVIDSQKESQSKLPCCIKPTPNKCHSLNAQQSFQCPRNTHGHQYLTLSLPSHSSR